MMHANLTRSFYLLVIKSNGHLGVNSIRANKLLYRLLFSGYEQKKALIFGRFLHLCSSSLFLFHQMGILYSFLSDIVKPKSMKTAQMFFEDCMAPS